MLCPGLVSTNIYAGRRNRQNAVYGEGDKDFGQTDIDRQREWMAGGIDPLVVGRRVVEGVEDNDLYILSHVEYEQVVRERFDQITAGFEKSKQSPALNALPKDRRPDVVNTDA